MAERLLAGGDAGTGSGLALHAGLMLLLAIATQACRIATGTVWPGLGVHVTFLVLSRHLIAGTGDTGHHLLAATSWPGDLVFALAFIAVAAWMLLVRQPQRRAMVPTVRRPRDRGRRDPARAGA